MNTMMSQCRAVQGGVAVHSSLRRPSLTLRTPARQVAGRRSCTVQAGRQRNTSSDRAVQAAEESTEDFQVKLNETIDKLKTKWDETDEKPAVIGIGVATFVAIWATSGLVDRIDKLPLIGAFLEFVGLLVTAWGVYRYLLFKPDREELRQNLDKFLDRVTGSK